ncbi:Mss4-like protein [Aspergillus flavus]|uniref:Mss4-like protein n=2 Tax=Aspergillus subgen. Circumdati TaxID=2720871 RepID=A0A7G5JTH3_ASPFN|nr:uncharacterized protein G4B84_002124 [Aspergillus flavus NRRL3357]KAJ1710851.1 Mss4-like protein [Aspergillus flavus]KJJ34205.1 hypothetical protein AFLA70_79g003520 [Aspergillus flavus AF70]GMF78972.1 unnamed protein product [Aspergillus oryzae]GMG54883.1 unnamed protein product [Aspergillus oryzae var. brunneus]KAF7631232.1 hypothetical protein AFLA_012092 [Aspergillus flavus NRRL3357]
MSTSTTEPVIYGSCYCQKTTYATTAPLYGLTYCYCRMCRLLHGSPFAAFTNVDSSHFQWTRSDRLVEINLSEYATRTICGVCRSPMTMVYHAKPNEVGIVAVTVDESKSKDKVPEKVGAHIFLECKPAWFVIPEDGGERSMGILERMRGVVPEGL